MKKFLFLIVFILFVNSANAITNLTNNYNTTVLTYSNNIVDNIYQLNNTDSLTKFIISIDLKNTNYPYNVTYYFYDSQNNKLEIKFNYIYEKDILLNNIVLTIEAFFNNNRIKFPKTNAFNKLNESYIKITYQDWIPFDNIDSFDHTIKFSSKEVSINQFYAEYPKNFFISKIILPSSTSIIKFTNINIEYADNGIFKTESEITSSYNSLNPVFALIFQIFKGLLWILNLTNFVSDVSYYEYQLYLLEPLIYLDYIISIIISLIKFITIMGMIWLFTISSMIIFLYSYSQSNDILDTFKIFIEYESKFIKYVFIQPVIWIYNNLLIKVIKLIRG